MKILVIDNTPANIQAALDQFANVEGVEITTVGSYQEFETEFRGETGKGDYAKIAQYDMVLTDLMMPENPEGKYARPKGGYRMLQTLHSKKTMEFPFGISIASFAKQAGVQHVGIVSMLDHHAGAFEWSLDFVSTVWIQMDSSKKVYMEGEMNALLPLFQAKMDYTLNTKLVRDQKGWVLVYDYLIRKNQM